MPRGTRQSSTQIVQVALVRAPAATGAGTGRVDPIVAQSMPSRPMMCVPSVTVPERTAVPPELRNSTVTFSHHRLSVGSRVGALQVRAAGEVWPGGAVPDGAPGVAPVGEVADGRDGAGADGADRRGRVSSWPEEPGEGVGAAGPAGPPAVSAVSAVSAGPSPAGGDLCAVPAEEPSSGTSVTDPVGPDDVPGGPALAPAAPTAV